jgi:hypothetical protein
MLFLKQQLNEAIEKSELFQVKTIVYDGIDVNYEIHGVSFFLVIFII